MSDGDGGQPVSVRWVGAADGHLELLDQTRLPGEIAWVTCRDVSTVIEAIHSLRVRGAPAIGIAGGYGVVVAANEARQRGLEGEPAIAHLLTAAEAIAAARPTAVNLRWAVERVLRSRSGRAAGVEPLSEITARLFRAAEEIHAEDRRLCTAIGRHGADVLPEGDVLTHCNTGALATGGDGTALAVITTAWADGRRFRVWADETRPLFQGARLTAWELVQRGIPVTVLCDSAAGHLLATGRIGSCIVGADRITAGGDTANKIGTYGLAVLAAAHGVPFYVAAPSSTFDLSIVDGAEIPIEHRGAAEVTSPWGRAIAPPAAEAFNPAFDVTPARLIRGIITEKGVIAPVTRAEVARVLGRA
jgi:methylthioribose-1-phosphate isomerase